MNKLMVLFGICLILLPLVHALVIEEPAFREEFVFDTSPDFSWSGCNASSYLLQISTDGFFDSMTYQSPVSTTSFDLPVDLSPNTYFARVNGIGESGDFICTSPTTEFIIKQNIPLSFFFDTSKYDVESLLITTVKGPLDAKVSVDISSSEGFYLPIVLDDLSNPTFELELPNGIYSFKASSSYADGTLQANQDITLGTVKKTTTTVAATSVVDDNLVNFTVLVREFDGENISQALLLLESNTTNISVTTNESGEAFFVVKKGDYVLWFEKEGFISDDDEIEITKDENRTFIVLSDSYDTSFKDSQESQVQEVQELDKFLYSVTLNDFEQSAFATSYFPLVFEVNGSYDRCQVLMKSQVQPTYQIIQQVLQVSSVNQVILNDLQEGESQVRIRCIVSSDEAYISQTKSVTLINIDEDISSLQSSLQESQKVVDRINSFPSSFKQVFISDVVTLENYISQVSELIKKAKSSTDLLQVKEEINNLESVSAKNMLTTIKINDTQTIISYGTLDDAKIVVDYLDISKSPKKLLEEQEQFAIKTNYNFVTLTYSSGEIVKQTFVSSQVLALDGVQQDISFDEYYIIPTFLTQRLTTSNDVLVKKYDSSSLVRILENSSSLIFEGWVDDTSLIRTMVLADGETLAASSPTGFVTTDINAPTWKVPLIAFVIIILVAGLFFNPYMSVLDVFDKDKTQQFASKVNECLDASLASNHDKVIQLIPKILDIHEKLSSQEQRETQEIITNVRQLFYDATYHTTYKKITSKSSDKWLYEELQVAIKDFYGSYAKLSPAKQRLYLHHFNEMLQYCEKLLDQVKK